ncbi:SRPBCC family protein [Pseudonocardia nigra]|uniref:SRPBCC family protein n=1 Tax=Pseudonocardia nigra TaxID=1921578 RepID=UPI001C5DBEB9|nr:SRPBCC family protein [Pseudonocardia nigra]
MIEHSAEMDFDRPANAVWAVVADYGRDPEWRDGVETMAPSPPGPVHPGQTTAEVMRFAGRTLRNDGIVTAVGPGLHFTWRTTSGSDAEGSRTVEELGPGRCRVRLEVRVRLHGPDRLLAPLMRVLVRRTLAGDLARLRRVAQRAGTPAG